MKTLTKEISIFNKEEYKNTVKRYCEIKKMFNSIGFFSRLTETATSKTFKKDRKLIFALDYVLEEKNTVEIHEVIKTIKEVYNCSENDAKAIILENKIIKIISQCSKLIELGNFFKIY